MRANDWNGWKAVIDAEQGEHIDSDMWKQLLPLVLACSACGVAEQPDSIRTVAAYEVPLPTASERDEFLAPLRQEAEAHGFHVDASNPEELRHLSEVSPMTINAAVWRGKDDDEAVASVMDQEDHLGQAWIMFSKGEYPERVARFRDSVMRKVIQRWPATASLPVVPSGGIPNRYQLERTSDGYKLKPEEASNYQVPADSPLVAQR